MSTATARPGLFALDELRELLDQHDGDVVDLLDEVARIVRRARAAVRRAAKVDEPEPTEKPTSTEQAAPEALPASQAPVVTGPVAPAARPAIARPAVLPSGPAVSTPAQRPEAVEPLVAIATTTSTWRRLAWRSAPWVPLLALAVALVLAALYGATVGDVAGAAAVLTLPAWTTRAAARADTRRRGGSSVRPPGRT